MIVHAAARGIVVASLWTVTVARAQEPAVQPGNTAATPDAARSAAATGIPGAQDRENGIHALHDGLFDAAIRYFLKYRETVKQREPFFSDATALLVQACLRAGKVEGAQKAILYHRQNSKGVSDPYYRDQLTYWTAKTMLALGDVDGGIKAVLPLVGAGSTPEYRNLALEFIGDASIRKKDWARAEAAYRRLLREFPSAANAPRVRLSLAYVLIAEGKTAEARKVLEEYKAQPVPGGGTANALRSRLVEGMILLGENKPLDALAIYQEIADQRPARPDPDWWRFVSGLLDALMKAGRYEEALAVAPAAKEVAPDTREQIRVQLKAVDCLIALKKADAAIAALTAFEKEFGTVPDLFPVLFRLGGLLRSQKSFQTATEFFERIARDESAPKDLRYKAAMQAGWCYRDGGDDEKAMQAFARAAQLGQKDAEKAEALYLAGDAAFRLGNFTAAALNFQTVADKYHDTPFAEEARYKQGLSRFQSHLYRTAADVYAQFVKEFPKSRFVDRASVERGIALRKAGDLKEAMQELAAFAEQHPDSPLAPRALIEAAESARLAGQTGRALALYSRVLDRYSDSDLAPYALYQRAHLNLVERRAADGVRDCRTFIDRYLRLPLAVDILFWLGDYYTNTGDLARGEEEYSLITSAHPKSPDAPLALYEAARTAFRRGASLRVENLLEQLTTQFDKLEPFLAARVEYLGGEVSAQKARYEEAAEHFNRAAELAAQADAGEKTAVRWRIAALGRLADMYFAMAIGDKKKEMLEKAADIYSRIYEKEADAPEDLKRMAEYRLAKVLEKQGNPDRAILLYLDVLYSLSGDVKKGRLPDYYYPLRSAYDAARLCERLGRVESARSIYQRVIDLGLPTSEDARARLTALARTAATR